MNISVILLILGLVALAIFVFLFATDFADSIRIKSLFKKEHCYPTNRIGNLWIDEPNKKWTVSGFDLLFDFDTIIDYDIQYDGISTTQNLTNMQLDTCAEMTAAPRKTFERLVVVVIMNDSRYPCVNIPVGKTKSVVGSPEFKNQLELAEKICNEIEKIKNIE